MATSSGKKRIYIGNLRPQSDLEDRLCALFGKSGIAVEKECIQVIRRGNSSNSNTNTKCSALVTCNDAKHAISCLNGHQMDGRRLLVEKEKKGGDVNSRQRGAGTNKKPSLFGSSGWSRPAGPTAENKNDPSRPSQQIQNDNPTEPMKMMNVMESESESDALQVQAPASADDLQVSQLLGEIVANEIKAAEANPSQGDPINAAIVSTAVMTLMASMHGASGMFDQREGEHSITESKMNDSAGMDDFRSMCQKPLSTLLADYGTEDPAWGKKIPTSLANMPQVDDAVAVSTTTTSSEQQQRQESRLAPQGKSPIHVTLVSFGYMHGIPPEIRSGGWSHAHPLVPLDCRHLPEVPPYLARQDGKSSMVKRAILFASDDDTVEENNLLKACSNKMSNQVLDALEQAIESGGYGHASPLRMAVHVGSDHGRHRSVVVCEMAAVAVRSMLRKNVGSQITQSVSVGTSHRDIERRQRERDDKFDVKEKTKPKQKDLESDW